MDAQEERVADSRNFHHPYQPYDIQRQFMNAVYECLESGKVGILESPTGTGKSLSLICGSLTWLRDHEKKNFEDGLNEEPNAENEPDWIVANVQARKREQALYRRDEREARLKAIREKEERARSRYESGEPPQKRQRITATERVKEEDAEADFLLKDYESDDEKVASKARNELPSNSLSTETQALMEKLGLSLTKTPEDKAESELEDRLKIFFCSRTHSQLGQFANEMRRVKMPPAITQDDKEPENQETALIEDLKHVTLGSRKQLCINPKVNKLDSTTAINERCLELQQSDTSADAKCKYLPTKDNAVLMTDFRDYALSKIRDIEDFGKLGQQIGICPYYASRAAVKPAEIVTLPYPLLLQKSAREALKLSLKGHVVIIDEAHNLMDAITNIHSVSVSLSQAKQSRAQLGVYLQKFRNKLKGKNRVYVTQLVRVIDSLISFMQSNIASTKKEMQVQISELLQGKAVDQVNLHKLSIYLQESRVARKVEGYLVHLEQENSGPVQKIGDKPTSKRSAVSPALTHVQFFLLALTNPAAEGRFFYTKPEGFQGNEDEILLKYRLLDPTYHFKDIVEEARAVILAGGTMSPMNDYTDHLFHYLPADRIHTLSCGHIIPTSNLLVLPVSKGLQGVDLEFTFEKRNSETVLNELGGSILELARVVPDGLVVFFPSYAYLDTAIQSWQRKTPKQPESLWAKLSSRKRIFLEPKSTPTSTKTPETNQNQPTSITIPSHTKAQVATLSKSASSASGEGGGSGIAVEALLAAYTSHIHNNKSTSQKGSDSVNGGAILFAVIGGSLSEGINFSDRLGRAVAIVGLPFPNAQSAEWKARMEFVAQRVNSSAGGRAGQHAQGEAAAREYYENACMRAVNQSVGRAIRHKDDYAVIVLLDRRYERAGIQGKLPGWIQRSLVRGNGGGSKGFAEAVGMVERFFEGKKSEK